MPNFRQIRPQSTSTNTSVNVGKASKSLPKSNPMMFSVEPLLKFPLLKKFIHFNNIRRLSTQSGSNNKDEMNHNNNKKSQKFFSRPKFTEHPKFKEMEMIIKHYVVLAYEKSKKQIRKQLERKILDESSTNLIKEHRESFKKALRDDFDEWRRTEFPKQSKVFIDNLKKSLQAEKSKEFKEFEGNIKNKSDSSLAAAGASFNKLFKDKIQEEKDNVLGIIANRKNDVAVELSGIKDRSKDSIDDHKKTIVEELEKITLPQLTDKELVKQTQILVTKLSDDITKVRTSHEEKLLKFSADEKTKFDQLITEATKVKSELKGEIDQGITEALKNKFTWPGVLFLLCVLILFASDLWEGDTYRAITDEIIEGLLLYNSASTRIKNEHVISMRDKLNAQAESVMTKFVPAALKLRLLTIIFSLNSILKNRDISAGFLMMLYSDHKNALECFDEVNEQYNNPVLTYLGLGIAFHNLGQLDEAKTCLAVAQQRLSESVCPYRKPLLNIQIQIESAMVLIDTKEPKEIKKAKDNLLILLNSIKNNAKFKLYTAIIELELIKLSLPDANNQNIYLEAKRYIDDIRSKQEFSINEHVNLFIRDSVEIYNAILEYNNKKFNHIESKVAKDAAEKVITQFKNNCIYYDQLLNLATLVGSNQLTLNPAKALITTHYEYGIMSNISNYTQLKLNNGVHSDFNYLKDNGWVVLADSNGLALENDGFSAVSYYNHSRNEIVVSFQGTKGKKQIIADLNAYYNDAQHLIFTYASAMVNRTQSEHLKYLSNQGTSSAVKPRLVLTGHSLGAWLAECTLWKINLVPVEDSPYSCIEAVTFESPGSKNLIEKMKKHYPANPLFPNPEVTTYVTSPNIVNTAKQHAGNLVQVNESKRGVPFNMGIQLSAIGITCLTWITSWWKSDYKYISRQQWIQAAQSHPLAHILDGFDKNTGSPKNILVSDTSAINSFPLSVKSWPLDTHEQQIYLNIENKGNARTKNLEWKVEDEHQLLTEANYNVEEMNLYETHKDTVSPRVWSYLQNYLTSNGEFDKNADYTVMRYTLNENILRVKSGLTVIQLKRYVEDRILKDNPFNFFKEVGFFANRKKSLLIKRAATVSANNTVPFNPKI